MYWNEFCEENKMIELRKTSITIKIVKIFSHQNYVNFLFSLIPFIPNTKQAVKAINNTCISMKLKGREWGLF